MSKTSDEDFVNMLNDMLEYFTKDQLAAELKVVHHNIDLWARRKNLPTPAVMNKFYKTMKQHSIWETF